MARKVTNEDIKIFNQKYYECHNFSQVARETGFSPSTVSKYVDRNWKPIVTANIKRVAFDIVTEINPDDVIKMFKGLDNYGELCILSDEEKAEMKNLWEEMEV